jgi:protocatechuate 3,4-dioxygenase beta subunit
LGGIPVILLSSTGVQVGYALTNSDGTYLFGGVVPGNYQVVFTPPGGYTALLPTSRQVAVPASGITGVDLPLTNANNTLGGFAYIDLNNDGVKQMGEPGIPGVNLTLNNGGFTTTATTDANGFYIFINVPNGTFTLTETQPVGYNQGKTTIGSAGGTSTTPDVVTSIVLGGSNNASGYNFGELGAKISGNVFDDLDGNGILNSSDPGMGGIILTLRDQTGNVVATTTSLPDGTYSFDAVIPGTYTLTEKVPSGQTATSPTSLTLSVPPGGIKDQNFGLSAKSSLSGSVYEDINHNGKRDKGEPGIPGVLVTLTGTSSTNTPVSVTALTGADGVFVVPNLAASNSSGYVLTETPPANYVKGPDSVGTSGGTKTSPGVISNIVLGSSTAATDYLFGEWSKQGTITGSVFLDSNQTGNPSNQPPIGGVVLLLKDQLGNLVATTKTAIDGSYFFKDIPPGNYTIEEQKPATYGVSPSTPSIIIPAVVPPTGGLVDNKDFGLVLATVSGTVFSDKNNDGIQGPGEPGIPGVVIKVYDASGNLVATTTTDSTGKYQFTNLIAGNYTILEEQPPFFVSGKETVGTLGGTSGDHTFNLNVPAGATGTGYNFAQLPVADPVGYVFSDLNNNGVKDPGEPGIPGVKVLMTGSDIQGNLISVNGVTDNTGLYVFAYRNQAGTLPLLPGVYNLYETQPAGWFEGKLQNGTPPATTVADNAFIGIDLTNPPFYGSGYNFGEIKPSSLGGSVFIDKNNNGKREAGDLGVGGVTIRLTGKDYKGNLVNATVVTDANGYYSFKGIAPGNYTLTEVVPVNYLAGVSKAGSGLTNNGNGGVNKISNIVIGPGQTGAQANFGLLGLIPNLISKRNFLTTTPATSLAKAGVPGMGVTFVNKP